jgi:hypothetical protein
VLIFTDGQVSGTEQILAAARSANIRISCLGIGSASQDRFLALLARETGGVSRFVTARERVDLSAVDLFASIGRPVAGGLKAEGSVQPDPPSSVFAGTPVVLFAGLPAGSAECIDFSWNGGRVSLPVPAGDGETGETIRLLQGARLITDWDSRYPSEEALASLDKRKQSRVAARLAELSREYGLASREMSLVAVIRRAGDKPGDLPDTRVVPVGMPRDTAFDAYFRSAGPQLFGALFSARAMPSPAAPDYSRTPKFLNRIRHAESAPEFPASQPGLDLITVAAMLEPDGGMPGITLERRAARTVAAIFAFVSEGHTAPSGAFRTHVARLVSFVETIQGGEQALIDRAVMAAATGIAPAGKWLQLAANSGTTWREVQRALTGPAAEARA